MEHPRMVPPDTTSPCHPSSPGKVAATAILLTRVLGTTKEAIGEIARDKQTSNSFIVMVSSNVGTTTTTTRSSKRSFEVAIILCWRKSCVSENNITLGEGMMAISECLGKAKGLWPMTHSHPPQPTSTTCNRLFVSSISSFYFLCVVCLYYYYYSLHTYELDCVTYRTQRYGVYPAILSAIRKYRTCSLETLYIGISKFILMGPTSRRIWVVHGCDKVTLAFMVCSVPPGSFFMVQRILPSARTNSALVYPVPGLEMTLQWATLVHFGSGSSTDTFAPKWFCGISARIKMVISSVLESTSSMDGKMRNGVEKSPVNR